MGKTKKIQVTEIFDAFPYLIVKDAAGAMEFYQKVFGAKELTTYTEPGGRIAHAELKCGPLTIMLADEFPEYDIHGPSDEKSGSRIHLDVNNVDELAGISAQKGAIITIGANRSKPWGTPVSHPVSIWPSSRSYSNGEIQKRINTDFVT